MLRKITGYSNRTIARFSFPAFFDDIEDLCESTEEAGGSKTAGDHSGPPEAEPGKHFGGGEDEGSTQEDDGEPAAHVGCEVAFWGVFVVIELLESVLAATVMIEDGET